MSSEIRTNPRAVALAIFALAFVTIGGAWIYQALGYPPCDLCEEQRYAYYVGVPLAALGTLIVGRLGKAGSLLFIALALIFAGNAALAVYQSGVELKLWQGPTACTGSAISGPANAGDLLSQLENVKVVRCDAVSLRVFGLSLANWNIFISLALSALSVLGAVLSFGYSRPALGPSSTERALPGRSVG
jgi:disulfide bond formation protein DsbB